MRKLTIVLLFATSIASYAQNFSSDRNLVKVCGVLSADPTNYDSNNDTYLGREYRIYRNSTQPFHTVTIVNLVDSQKYQLDQLIDRSSREGTTPGLCLKAIVIGMEYHNYDVSTTGSLIITDLKTYNKTSDINFAFRSYGEAED